MESCWPTEVNREEAKRDHKELATIALSVLLFWPIVRLSAAMVEFTSLETAPADSIASGTNRQCTALHAARYVDNLYSQAADADFSTSTPAMEQDGCSA